MRPSPQSAGERRSQQIYALPWRVNLQWQMLKVDRPFPGQAAVLEVSSPSGDANLQPTSPAH